MSSTALGLMDFVKAAKAQIDEVDADQLQRMMSDTPDLFLLDCREPNEHTKAHLDAAHLVPRGLIEAAGDPAFPGHNPDLVAARDKTVVVYCATGGRSAMAAATLKMMGFPKVYSLDGGLSKWIEEGRPVVEGAG